MEIKIKSKNETLVAQKIKRDKKVKRVKERERERWS